MSDNAKRELRGTEKHFTDTLGRRILDGQPAPAGAPLPAIPKGGTPNHEGLGYAVRIWALEPDSPLLPAEVESVETLLLRNDFMCRARADEFCSPSHWQWWITFVLAIRWRAVEALAWGPVNEQYARLLAITGQWLRWFTATCSLFYVPGVGILAPGMRAMKEKGTRKPLGGHNSAALDLYRAIQTGQMPPENRLEREEAWEGNLDTVYAFILRRLLAAKDDFGKARNSRELPRFRKPVNFVRKGADWVAWVDSQEGGVAPDQVGAGWVGGRERYWLELPVILPESLWGRPVEVIVGGAVPSPPPAAPEGDSLEKIAADLRSLAGGLPRLKETLLTYVARLEKLA